MSHSALIERTMAVGETLAESKWKGMVSDLEGINAPFTAILLENTAKYLADMDETIRTQHVGNFDRFAFPLVKAVYPTLCSQDLVSVQPMSGPTGLVFYYDVVYGSNKGRIRAGTPMFSSQTGHTGDDFYSGRGIEEEGLATGDGATATFTPTLAYTPVVKGTLTITDGTQVVRDDGNGNIVGDINPSGTNTVVHATGVLNFTFATAPASGAAITASYEYDNEANQNIPEVDFQITSMHVVARKNALRTRYSLEAAQNLRSLYGLSAEMEQVTALAQELRFEIDRTIIKEVHSFAQADAVTWPQAPSAAISFTEHKVSLIDIFIRASNNIYALTRRGSPNWIVMGLEVSSVVESLPTFKASDEMSTPNGVVPAGVLHSRWRCYKDPYNIDNSAGGKNFLVGYKGMSFLEAGYVYAPYIPFFTTPSVVLDDMIVRKGMATLWGKRKVNGRFYCKGSVVGNFSP